MRNPFRRGGASQAAVAPPPPAREIGYANPDAGAIGGVAGWYESLADEHVPELRFPQAYDVYDQMKRTPQVNSVLSAVMLPILRTGWRIDGTGCRPEATQLVARDLGLPIVGEGDAETTDGDWVDDDERFDWGEHLEVALDEYLGYGHSIFEQKAAWGETDGLWHLHKLGYRPPRSISRFNTARDGGLISLEQDGGSFGGKPTPLGVNRVVVYVRQRKGSNWRGQSLLRPAYAPFLYNNRASRVEMIVAERAGAPLTVYTGAEDEGEAGLAKGEDVARRARAGQNAGAAIAYGAKLEQEGIKGTLPDIEKIKRYNDEQIARTVLAHFLNLGQASGTGSYALGDTLGDFFTLSVQATAAAVARTARRHVVRDLVHWNWPGDRVPKLVFDEIGSRQNAILQAVAILVNAGVLQADESLEQFIRTTLGLPAAGNPLPREEAS